MGGRRLRGERERGRADKGGTYAQLLVLSSPSLFLHPSSCGPPSCPPGWPCAPWTGCRSGEGRKVREKERQSELERMRAGGGPCERQGG